MHPSRTHLYQEVELFDFTGEPTNLKAYLLKDGVKFEENLVPEELTFYKALTDIEQLQVRISADPFTALETLMRNLT